MVFSFDFTVYVVHNNYVIFDTELTKLLDFNVIFCKLPMIKNVYYLLKEF